MGRDSIMLANKYRELAGEEKPMTVDLGYITEQSVRDLADAIIEFGISIKNFCIEYSNRMLVTIPKTKQEKFLEAFPQTRKESTYWQTTHSLVPSKKDKQQMKTDAEPDVLELVRKPISENR